jgi:hypothetical protein
MEDRTTSAPRLAFLAALGAATRLASAQWSVIDLHPPGATDSYAFGIRDGQIVGKSSETGGARARVWTGSGRQWVTSVLNPPFSTGYGVGAGVQVGSVIGSGGLSHAVMWTGSAATLLDLHPASARNSWAIATGTGQQGGYFDTDGGTGWHAALWTGSAASLVELNPPSASQATISALDGNTQCGTATVSGADHASLWHGTAASWVDLHPAGADSSHVLAASNGIQAGYIETAFHLRASIWSGSAASWTDLQPASVVGYSVCAAIFDGQQAGAAGLSRAAFWNGSASSWTDLDAILNQSRPMEFAGSYARGIWHDESYTYVVGFGSNHLRQDSTDALLWVTPRCYPNCDGSAAGAVLNVADFSCFLGRFAAADMYANCDGSTATPVLNVLDFSCFLQKYAAGCP